MKNKRCLFLFWNTNNINSYCDNQDIVGMTKRINGGTIGLEDRKKHYEHALEVLGGHYSPSRVSPLGFETVRIGSRGHTVIRLQEELGLDADGIFGKGTEAKLKGWQSLRGLTADGIAGPQTLGILFND